MRFLADESCDAEVVRLLRAAGPDVMAVAELTPRAEDAAVIDLAVREERVLLTEDKDFGHLVYAHRHPSAGVVLIRFPGDARRTVGEAVARAVDALSARLAGSFVVVQPGRVRIGQTPG